MNSCCTSKYKEGSLHCPSGGYSPKIVSNNPDPVSSFLPHDLYRIPLYFVIDL